jgi:hypothetical protein
MIKLTKKDGQIVPEELWNTAKMRIAHGNAVRFGQYILGSSSSGQGPAFLVALDIRTGKRAWTERGYDTATLIKADGKILLLAEDGLLVLASATPKGLTVHSKCKITERLSWTAPTLVGTTLYVRDRKHVMALGDVHCSRCAFDLHSVAGLLHPRATGDKGRSDGGLETRVTRGCDAVRHRAPENQLAS